jgi:DNA repair exonuclease SbcCD ATPase subunit
MKTKEWFSPGNIVVIICTLFTVIFEKFKVPVIAVGWSVKMVLLLKVAVFAIWFISVISIWVYTFKARQNKKYYETEREAINDELIEKKATYDKSINDAVKENDRLIKGLEKCLSEFSTLRNNYSKIESQYGTACQNKSWLLSIKQIEEKYDDLYLRQIENCQTTISFIVKITKDKMPNLNTLIDPVYNEYLINYNNLKKELKTLHEEYSEINKGI